MIIKIISYVPTEILKNGLDIRATHNQKEEWVTVLVRFYVKTAF